MGVSMTKGGSTAGREEAIYRALIPFRLDAEYMAIRDSLRKEAHELLLTLTTAVHLNERQMYPFMFVRKAGGPEDFVRQSSAVAHFLRPLGDQALETLETLVADGSKLSVRELVDLASSL